MAVWSIAKARYRARKTKRFPLRCLLAALRWLVSRRAALVMQRMSSIEVTDRTPAENAPIRNQQPPWNSQCLTLLRLTFS
jgi:hypothetical protein